MNPILLFSFLFLSFPLFSQDYPEPQLVDEEDNNSKDTAEDDEFFLSLHGGYGQFGLKQLNSFYLDTMMLFKIFDKEIKSGYHTGIVFGYQMDKTFYVSASYLHLSARQKNENNMFFTDSQGNPTDTVLQVFYLDIYSHVLILKSAISFEKLFIRKDSTPRFFTQCSLWAGIEAGYGIAYTRYRYYYPIELIKLYNFPEDGDINEWKGTGIPFALFMQAEYRIPDKNNKASGHSIVLESGYRIYRTDVLKHIFYDSEWSPEFNNPRQGINLDFNGIYGDVAWKFYF